MRKYIDQFEPHIKLVCDKALAMAFILSAILGAVVLALTLGSRD